ncbi:helix-turn-helix domain-containing protein [Nocardia otitidiscaviarum]|uniref:helix-turn-helix domain-containing protein n=1 Tax=Nocardia otitidiscaviarum TaxID=1823 RepID=UPI001894E420|nr:helix-turn-helix transcriptional regulator [Nocardia otitidiscaviarum]MBF6178885.1 helix-turn-helix domain-containing protein [Nocardia otitidiscaviarum]
MVDTVRAGHSDDGEADEMAGTTVARMDFGAFVQAMRKAAGQVPLAAAKHIDTSRQTIMRLEEGWPTRLSTPQIEQLIEFYGGDRDQRAEAIRLWEVLRSHERADQAQGNSKSYWQPYSDQFVSQFPHYLRLESAANAMVSHQLVLVPGLLQIPEYRRAVILIDEPNLSPVDTERRLELMAHRQSRLSEAEFRVEVLLSEAVLRHQPASPAVMADQLRWLVEVGEQTNISVRVVPFGVGPHRGLIVQSFTLLEFPRGASGLTVPPVVYLDVVNAPMTTERADVVDQYRQAITQLRAVALTEKDTRDLVNRVAKEYAG